MLLPLTLLLIGILLLYGGAEALVLGATQLALNMGIPRLIVGLTIVSFATSMPEAVSSFFAQFTACSGDVAVGNVIGSNIANIGLGIGFVALVRPIQVTKKVILKEIVIMIGVTAGVVGLMMIGPFTRIVGALLLLAMLLFLIYQIKSARKEKENKDKNKDKKPALHLTRKQLFLDSIYIVIGTAALIAGGYLFIQGALNLAAQLGIPDRIIGLTLIALSTSLPEMATSFVAVFRDKSDISIGNIIGSNIFNLLFVLGAVSLVIPITFSRKLLTHDATTMLLFSVAIWLFMLRHGRLNRIHGALLVGGYILYLGSL